VIPSYRATFASTGKQTSQDKKLTKEIERRRTNSSVNGSQLSRSLPTPAIQVTPQQGNNSPTSSVSSRNIAIPMQQQVDMISPPALSPPCFYDLTNQFNDDPFGNDKEQRQTFVDLISTLNNSYPDYDFRHVKPEFFVKLSLHEAFQNINNSLQEVFENEQFGSLWKTVNEIIDLNHTEVYSYVPDQNLDDPMADPLSLGDSKLWTWNYFFVNRKLKRLVFFTAYGKSKASALEDDEREGMMYGNDYDDQQFFSNPKNAGVHFDYEDNPYDDDEMDFDDL